jgi:intracellular multiplication protein IcmT
MDLHWRNTQKPARFFALDARASITTIFFLAHAKMWTFVLAIVVMVIFWFFERRGLTFDAALRAFRSWLVGRRRPALRPGTSRNWTDFG